MGLRIATNVTALSAGRELEETTRTHSRSVERLASGDRIVRSADDAASLSISEKLKGSIRSFQMAHRNTQDGISMLQTAEGGIVEAQNMLLRLRELSVQAASDTVGENERQYTNTEFQHLKSEIQRIANTTEYGGTPLLNGGGSTLDIQVGVDHSAADRISYSSGVANVLPAALGITALAVDTKEGARSGLTNIDSAIQALGQNRAYLGGLQSQLSSQMANIDVHRSNLVEGNSRLRDTDMAEWTAKEVSQRIRQESGTAMVAQANGISKIAVTLLEKA